jgi:hypothetical protein
MVCLSDVVNAADNKGYSLQDIVFSDVEVCHECHSVLFIDDEAYSTHSNNVLCDSCSCRCEHCEAYFMEKELSLNGEGLSLCSSCLVKDTLDKTSLIENPEGITPALPFIEEQGTILLHHWTKSNHLDNGIVKHGDRLPKSALPHLVAHAVSLGYYFSVSPREDDLVFMFDNRRLVVR